MSLIVTTATAAPAETPDCSGIVTECHAIIKKCDDALADKKKALDIYSKALDSCRSSSLELQKNLNIQLENNQSLWHNPVVMIILGVAVGSFAGFYLARH